MQAIDTHISQEQTLAWDIVRAVNDPEIPVISIVDLGIVRDIQVTEPSKNIIVSISPTYSGCPAMDVISTNIRLRLISHGYQNVEVKTILSPAWTSDWISEEGRQKLKKFGIAPPQSRREKIDFFATSPAVHCPLCDSDRTHLVSEFGSTACKALYKCDDCLEPFDVFKCH